MRAYVGDVDARGRPHGRGRATYEDGSAYEGEFEHGARHGRGRMTLGVDSESDSSDDDVEGGGRVGGYHDGSWARDAPFGAGTQVSTNGCALRGRFDGWRTTGECRTTRDDGETLAYVGELSAVTGWYHGIGTAYDAIGGWEVSAERAEGELASSTACAYGYGRAEDGAEIVLAWTRANVRGIRTRRQNIGDIASERAIVVRLSEGRRLNPRELVRRLNALDAREREGLRRAVERIDGVEVVCECGGTSVEIERYLERARVRVDDTGVFTTRAFEPGELVAHFSGKIVSISGDISTLDAERLSRDAVMLRSDDVDDYDVVEQHDEDAPYARSHGVRAMELEREHPSASLAANFARIETKVETNCERVYVEDHPLLGETVFLRAKRRICEGEECTVAPDYFFGWCLDPKSEAGYYENMRCRPPRVTFQRQGDEPELGRVSVKQHGRWRAIYLDKVEQGLSYLTRTGKPEAMPDVLGFQYIRVMARETMNRLSTRRRTGTRALVVAVGLGSGALPLYVANHSSARDVRILTLERSQTVIDACSTAMFVPLHQTLSTKASASSPLRKSMRARPIEVLRCDAFDFFGEAARAHPSVNAVLLDAYDGKGRIPVHIRSVDFIRDLGRTLVRGGFCVCNCWDGKAGSRAARELATFEGLLARHIGLVHRVIVEGQENNVVLVATRTSRA